MDVTPELIGAGAAGVALILTTIGNLTSNRKVSAKIGNPNGQGDLTTMLLTVQSDAAKLSSRVGNLEQGHVVMTTQLEVLSGQVSSVLDHQAHPET
jgi:hypothetical protein